MDTSFGKPPINLLWKAYSMNSGMKVSSEELLPSRVLMKKNSPFPILSKFYTKDHNAVWSHIQASPLSCASLPVLVLFASSFHCKSTW